MRKILLALAIVACASACTHNVVADDVAVQNESIFDYAPAAADIRLNVAHQTCEANYDGDKQNYLAAVETAIAAGRGNPEGSLAPLDAFRAEINAAYNAVVMRCKTHMHCLEAHGYDEAKCYMAATDRKDAERRFADLAEDLRLIETRKKAAALRRPPSVTVTTTNNIDQDVDQNQSNESQTGNRIEDQDILQVCGDARNLLSARCRKPCPKC